MRRVDRSNRIGAVASFSPTMQVSTAYQQELIQKNVGQSKTNVGKRCRPPAMYDNVNHDLKFLNERRHSLDTRQFDDEEFPVYSKFMYPAAVAKSATYAYLRESLNRSNESIISEPEIDVASAADMEILSHNGQHIYYAENVDTHVLNTEKVVRNLTAFGRFLEMLQRWPLPPLSLTTACICFLLAIFISPRTCAQSIIFPAFRLSFGTLYPAYASYKAVRTKNVKEYVKWMMYWIVYAFFTCIETFTDIFLSWFPFYYEVKVITVLWLLSPATKGSSTLYRKFVHPMLTRREQEIDEYLNQAKERGYSAVLQLGSKGVNYATNVIMQTALKGGGNLVQTIRRSYSLSDLSEPDMHRTQDEIDAVAIRPQQRMLRPRMQTAVGRSASGTRHSTGMYFTEVDVAGKGAGDFNYNIRSSEDISSGYSSAEPGLSRTSSMTNASKARSKAKRSEIINYDPQITPLERKHVLTRYVPASVLNDWKEDDVIGSELYFRSAHPVNFETEQKMLEVPWSNIAIDTLESLNINMSEDSRNSSLKDMLESCDRKVESSLNLKTIMMPYTDELHVKNNLEEIESEEDENFEDAISAVDTVDNISSYAKEHSKDQIYGAKSYGVSNEETPIVSPEDLQDTLKEREVIIDETSNDEKTTFSPKELRDTLQEIKNNFRATIEVSPTHSLLKLQKNEIESEKRQNDNNIPQRMLTHKKGKAPSPPLPLSRPPIPTHSSSLSSLHSSTDNTDASSMSSIFKNFKTNIFHSNKSTATREPERMKKSILIETEI